MNFSKCLRSIDWLIFYSFEALQLDIDKTDMWRASILKIHTNITSGNHTESIYFKRKRLSNFQMECIEMFKYVITFSNRMLFTIESIESIKIDWIAV